MRPQAVPHVRAHDFRVPLTGGEPAVVVDAANEWPAVTLWRPGYLKGVAGHREVSVREIAGPPVNIFQKLVSGGITRFSEYLDWVLEVDEDVSKELGADQTGRGPLDVCRLVGTLGFDCSYYLNCRLDALSAALLDDIQVPNWFGTDVRSINLWCGVFGTSCGLHCDLVPNCNVQVTGRKSFTMFAPAETSLLYPIKGRTHCRFDPNSPDFDTFPLAREATRWDCILEPGEALYIPVGWYHQATVISGWATNVNVFWRRPFPHGLATPGVWPHLVRQARALSLARLGVAS
jgi:hypothetical protein